MCHGGFDKEYQLLPLLYFKEIKDTERYEYYYKYWFSRKHTLSNVSGVYKKSGAKKRETPTCRLQQSLHTPRLGILLEGSNYT